MVTVVTTNATVQIRTNELLPAAQKAREANV